MRHWLTRADMNLRQGFVKRFEPSHWTIDFPRGAMASVVSQPGEDRLNVHACFGAKADLVGLIYKSADDAVHVGHRRHNNQDYSRCTLRFRWQSEGVIPLDAVDGPTLTIEGRDDDGLLRVSYVRLWNYAEGNGTDAIVTLPFDRLRAGFEIGAETELVDVSKVERLFISLVPIGYTPGSEDRFPAAVQGRVEISEIGCEGSGSVIAINDAFVPEHPVRICTAYDDCYHLTPERVIDGLERLGYRSLINHYVGMSHYPALSSSGLADPDQGLNVPARRWHESFASIAAERGYSLIWSLSMELLDQFCPGEWKQRDWRGVPATTGYTPPSTLLSPASIDAMNYLGRVASAFLAIGEMAGLEPMLQIGEPAWWVNSDRAPCLYDPYAASLWATDHAPITDARDIDDRQTLVLDQAGSVLGEALQRILAQVRSEYPQVRTHLLIYLPSALDPTAPELRRANLPLAWKAPAFDVLQVEDYEWVTKRLRAHREQATRFVLSELNYTYERSHYLSGFASLSDHAKDWDEIVHAAAHAREQGFGEVFIWALPQIFRDGLTLFEGEPQLDAFRDVIFPLDLSLRAVVEPCFSTSISTSMGGYEYRNVNWQQARLRVDVGPCVRSMQELQQLLHFYRSMRGNAIGFRFRDRTDFSSAGMTDTPGSSDILLGEADGQRRLFPLIKKYGDGETRRITRPVEGSVSVSIDDVVASGWLLSGGGIVEFEEAPPAGSLVKAGFLFDVPVRFEEESLKVSQKTFLAGEVASIPLIEIKEA